MNTDRTVRVMGPCGGRGFAIRDDDARARARRAREGRRERMAGWFYRAMHREPVVMWSCAIGGLGMALPAIVPRELVETFSRDGKATREVPSAAAVAKALRPSA